MRPESAKLRITETNKGRPYRDEVGPPFCVEADSFRESFAHPLTIYMNRVDWFT